MIIVKLRPNDDRRDDRVGSHPLSSVGFVDWRITMRPHLWRPSTDLIELEDRYIIRVEVAGMKESDFQISMDQNTLTIRGTRVDSGERKAFHQMEIHFGEFITQVEIPSNIEREKAEAEYIDGFLRIIMPKAQPKQIRISKE